MHHGSPCFWFNIVYGVFLVGDQQRFSPVSVPTPMGIEAEPILTDGHSHHRAQNTREQKEARNKGEK
jgi:hypothetical protein